MPNNQTPALERHILLVDKDADYLATLGDSLRSLSAQTWRIHTATGTSPDPKSLEHVELILVHLGLDEATQLFVTLKQQHPKLKRVAMAAAGSEDAALLTCVADFCIDKTVSPEGLRSVHDNIRRLLGDVVEEGTPDPAPTVAAADLVQMECLAGNSSVVEFYLEHPLGRIYIENGLIIHAACGDLFGEPGPFAPSSPAKAPNCSSAPALAMSFTTGNPRTLPGVLRSCDTPRAAPNRLFPRSSSVTSTASRSS
jgi:hypothetical protein